jgi:hypothetical protein
MLIRCFAIILMVDTIYFASSRSSLKFPSTFGIVHCVLLHHLDFYLDHATFFPVQVWGGIHEFFVSTTSCALYIYVSQPYFGQVWGWSPTLGKSEDLESSETPECSEFDSKAQSTSHWGFLGVIGKVLKRRYRKWHRIDHLNICSPSYGQKKGRESNWQFDSRPLKVGNRPLYDLWIESAIRRWKDIGEGYKFGSDLVAIKLCSRELWAPKVPGLHPGQFRDSNPGVPGKKWHLGVGAAESHRVYYRE